MVRSFIAIDISREAINEIKEIQNTLKNANLFVGKLTEPENLHLTLKFLGEITDEQVEEVKEKLKGINFSGFSAQLGEVGVFDKKYPKIIWIKLNGGGIFNLQKEIDEKLKDLFKPEERFMSHITLARVKNVSAKKEFFEYLDSIKPSKINFNVDKFFLKKSELKEMGPVYTDLEEFSINK